MYLKCCVSALLWIRLYIFFFNFFLSKGYHTLKLAFLNFNDLGPLLRWRSLTELWRTFIRKVKPMVANPLPAGIFCPFENALQVVLDFNFSFVIFITNKSLLLYQSFLASCLSNWQYMRWLKFIQNLFFSFLSCSESLKKMVIILQAYFK